jgi:hypothetical protein
VPTTETKLAKYYVRIAGFLGFGFQKLTIINSSILVAISFFYIFTLAAYSQVTVYIFIRGVTYINAFDDYLITRYYDGIVISSLTLIWLVLSLVGKTTKIVVSVIYGMLLITALVASLPTLIDVTALMSLPMIVFFLSYHKTISIQKKLVQNISLRLVLNYFVTLGIIMGIITMIFSLSRIFMSKSIPVHNYPYDLFVLFSSFSTIMLVLIFFCLPVKILTIRVIAGILKHKPKWRWPSASLNVALEPYRISSGKIRLICLLIFVLFSISLALIPHLPTINKDNKQIGVDSSFYVNYMNRLQHSQNLQDFIQSAFIEVGRGDRPLTLILLFILTTIINAPALDIFEHLPVILGPSLVIVVYFLTRELTSNETTSLFAAFLTGIGYYQISIGIYGGLYANWIGLIVGYSSLVFFFRFLKTSSKTWLFIFFILLLTALFCHAYTWTILIIAMGAFLGVSFIFKSYPRKRIILVLLVILSSVVIDVVKTTLVESVQSAHTGGIKSVIVLSQTSVQLKELALAWHTFVYATQYQFGSILPNFIVLGLVLYWVIRSNLRIQFNMFIAVFLTMGIGPLFLGDWVVQSRLFYDIPFQIPAAIALTYISRQKNANTILLPIYVWLIAISIRMVSNFYEVLPT